MLGKKISHIARKVDRASVESHDFDLMMVGAVQVDGMIVGMGALPVAVVVEPCAIVVKEVQLWLLVARLCLGDS